MSCPKKAHKSRSSDPFDYTDLAFSITVKAPLVVIVVSRAGEVGVRVEVEQRDEKSVGQQQLRPFVGVRVGRHDGPGRL